MKSSLSRRWSDVARVGCWSLLALLLLGPQHVGVLAQDVRVESMVQVAAGGHGQSGAFTLVSTMGAAQPSGQAEGGRFSMQGGAGALLPPAPVAPVITHVPASGAAAGEDVVLDWQVESPAGIVDARLLYRSGGAAAYEDAATDAVGDGRFRSTIPAGAVTGEGLAYYMSVTDSSSLTTRLPVNGFYAATVHVAEPGLVREEPLPGGTDQSAYRLISVPLNLEDKAPDAVLQDDLGPYGEENWRFFELLFDQSVTEYPETDPMAPGRAFWIISREPVDMFDTGEGTSVALDEPYMLPLHPRWNLIGNPFSFPVPVDNLSLGTGQQVELRSYVEGWNDPIGAPVTALRPFSGYALFNPSAAVDTLYVEPRLPDVESATGAGSLAQRSSTGWSIRIRARSRDAMDADNVAAVAPGAAAEWDVMDYAEPPTIGTFVSVYFPRPEWGRLGERYSTDVRPASSEGEVWTFQVSSNIDAPVRLAFDGVRRLPSELEAWLVDDLLAVSQDLRLDPSYALSRPAVEEPRRLRLVVGNTSYVDRQLADIPSVPREHELLPAFPNPFRSGTTIPYALSVSSDVSLKVFDVTGRLVATPLDGTQSAGYHSIVWDGRGTEGRRLPSGVYLLRLNAGGSQLTRSVVIVQ